MKKLKKLVFVSFEVATAMPVESLTVIVVCLIVADDDWLSGPSSLLARGSFLGGKSAGA
jgi:hypothetical protein